MSDIAKILGDLSAAVKNSSEFTSFGEIAKKVDDDAALQADFKAFESENDAVAKAEIHKRIMKNGLFLEYINAKNNLDLLKNDVFNEIGEAFGLTKKGGCGGCGGCGGGCSH